MRNCKRRMTTRSSGRLHAAIIQETRRKLKRIEESIKSALSYFGDKTRAGGGRASAKDHEEAHEKWYDCFRTARQRNPEGAERRSSTAETCAETKKIWLKEQRSPFFMASNRHGLSSPARSKNLDSRGGQ